MTDARGRLVDDPFDYRVTKRGEVMISRGGRIVLTLGGPAGERVLRALERAGDELAEQLVLAKATGHYRHGTER